MPPTTSHPGGRFRRFILVAALAAVMCAGFATCRLGSILFDEDPLRRSDAIFVLAGTRMERPLEAADLYLQGFAPLIVLLRQTPDGGMVALARRGVEIPADAEVARDALVRVGVPAQALLVLPRIHDNTAQEAHSLRTLIEERRLRRVIVVTSKYHTRRAGFAMRRELKGSHVEVIMRASRYDRSNPDLWWRTRADVRSAALESQKLVAYMLGLGQ